MSNIPPYQMGSPGGGPAPKGSSTPIWVWVLVGLAGMCVVCGLVGAAVLFPVFSQARISAKNSRTLSNAKIVSISMANYMADSDDVFPPIENGPSVVRRLKPYLKDSRLEGLASEYQWNQALSRLNSSSIDNAQNLWMLVTKEPPEMKKVAVGFVDIHVRLYKREEVAAITAVKPVMVKSK